jgi:biotin carboxyl carrier protein
LATGTGKKGALIVKYNLRIQNDIEQADVSIEGDRQLAITLNETKYQATGSVISGHHLHLAINGTGTNAFIVPGKNGRKTIVINGVPYGVEDADAHSGSQRRGRAAGTQPQEVTPPMPAVVVSVLVSPGDTVKKGDGVIVVAAMKMETTLTAPYDGKVAKINAAEEDKVMPGDILIEIEQ